MSTLQDVALRVNDRVTPVYFTARSFRLVSPKRAGQATFLAREEGTDNPVVTCHVADFFKDGI
uniref:p14 n=1 Tax=Pseudomonas phage phi7 TaxID=90888 RepID=Q9XJN7_9VIRU|nr:P14 [Pseudomonas phage phi7]